jgi:hypothetical protein
MSSPGYGLVYLGVIQEGQPFPFGGPGLPELLPCLPLHLFCLTELCLRLCHLLGDMRLPRDVYPGYVLAGHVPDPGLPFWPGRAVFEGRVVQNTPAHFDIPDGIGLEVTAFVKPVIPHYPASLSSSCMLTRWART